MRIHQLSTTILLVGLLAGAGEITSAQDGDPPQPRREQPEGARPQRKGQEERKEEGRRKRDESERPAKEGEQGEKPVAKEKPAKERSPAYTALAEEEDGYRQRRVQLRRLREEADAAKDETRAAEIAQELAALEVQHNERLAEIRKEFGEEAVDAALKELREEGADRRERPGEGAPRGKGPEAGELDEAAQAQLLELKKEFNRKRKTLQDEYRRQLHEARNALGEDPEPGKLEAMKADMDASYQAKMKVLKEEFDRKKASLEAAAKKKAGSEQGGEPGGKPANEGEGKQEPPRPPRERPDKGDGARKQEGTREDDGPRRNQDGTRDDDGPRRNQDGTREDDGPRRNHDGARPGSDPGFRP